jgi:hypothetical protein
MSYLWESSIGLGLVRQAHYKSATYRPQDSSDKSSLGFVLMR